MTDMDSFPLVKSKKPRISKNRKKKAWRKFSNIADVEQFLEEQQDDHFTGGPMHEKKDSEIFKIDLTSGADEIPLIKEELIDNVPDIKDLGCRNEANQKDISWKNLRCFRSLPGGRGPEDVKPHQKESLKQTSREIHKITKLAFQNKLQKMANAVKKLKQPIRRLGKDPVFNRDLWASSEEKNNLIKIPSANPAPARLPPTLRNKKLSTVSAVEIPHPGSSYNPAPGDHEALLAVATKNALRKAVEEQKLTAYRKTRALGVKTSAEVWMDEMEEGLQTVEQKKNDEIKEESVEMEEEDPVGQFTRFDRKTKTERKRKEKAHEKEEQRRLLKMKRARENDVFNAKSILKSIRKKEAELVEKMLKKKAKIEDPARIRRLGKQKFEEADPDVKLKEDMTDNLRTLQPEGNLAVDRYKSLQKRNIVEPRRRQKIKRKYKLKKYQIEGRKIENMK